MSQPRNRPQNPTMARIMLGLGILSLLAGLAMLYVYT